MTPTNLTEASIEQLAIELLQSQGFNYSHGGDIAPDSDQYLRNWQGGSISLENRRKHEHKK